MVKIKETPTKIVLTFSDWETYHKVDAQFSYRPDRYWMSASYQVRVNHLKKIEKAREDGNESLAQALESRIPGWDGYIRLLERRKNVPELISGTLNRGHLAALKLFCLKHSIEVDGSELIPNPFQGLVLDDIPDDLLAVPLDPQQWDIQKRCVLAWLKSGIARNQVTVSGGKTAMFCAAAAFVKRRFPNARFVYFTPTERLVTQVYDESRRFLPGWSISKFGGGSGDNTGTDMVVCTWAMLNSRYNALLASGWFKTFNSALIDECQSATSATAKKILSTFPAFFRFAASDTTRENNPGLKMELEGLCGPLCEVVKTVELINLDRIATPTIEVVKVPSWRGRFSHVSNEPEEGSNAFALIKGEWIRSTYLGPAYETDKNGQIKARKDGSLIEKPGFHRLQAKSDGRVYEVESSWCILQRTYDQAITSFKARNELIAKRAADYSSKGWPTLVIATRTLHVMILEAVIKKAVADPALVKILYSAHSAEERNETFQWLKSTPGAILVSPLVKVGVSINELVAGVIADKIADWELARQIVGRFIRKKPNGTPNEAFITLFEENQHPALHRTSKALIAKLKGVEGYRWTETTVLPDGEEL